jgi:hypothetical protein
MYELPVATQLAVETVRRQFDPAAPPEPQRPRRSFRLVRQLRATAAAILRRAAVPAVPERIPAH